MHAFALAFLGLFTGLSIADGEASFTIDTTFALIFTADALIVLWCISWSIVLSYIKFQEFRRNSFETAGGNRRQDRPPHSIQPYNTQSFMRSRNDHMVLGYSLPQRRNMRAQTPLFLCLLLFPIMFTQIMACLRVYGTVDIPYLTILSPITSSFFLTQLIIVVNVCSAF